MNQQFQAYIASVPSFDAASTYKQGYTDGYEAGFLAGYEVASALPMDATEDVAGSPPASPASFAANAPMSAREAQSDTGASLTADDNSEPNVGVDQFRKVVTGAFGASSLLFLLVAWCGFATFGDASDPLILNNYASSDPLASIARLGVLLAVLFEFPLLERPFRLTALELLLPIPQFTGAITRIANGPVAAIASVGFISAIAATGVPLDTLAGVGGCTSGALLIYVAPALMTLKLREQQMSAEGTVATGGGGVALDAKTIGLWTLVFTGVALGLIGTVDALGQMQPPPPTTV